MQLQFQLAREFTHLADFELNKSGIVNCTAKIQIKTNMFFNLLTSFLDSTAQLPYEPQNELV